MVAIVSHSDNYDDKMSFDKRRDLNVDIDFERET